MNLLSDDILNEYTCICPLLAYRHLTLKLVLQGHLLVPKTALALIDLVENLTKELDKKKITVGVFIDLKKAFDTIDHSLLIKKLEFYGIRGVPLNWLESYLDHRKQYVHFNDTDSYLQDVVCGVPQGSILGQKLFILYINDICNTSNVLKFILFADDTNSFCTGSNLKEICQVITSELEKLNIWFSLNKLSLNVTKTNYMVFGKKNNNSSEIIKFNNHTIERMSTAKFLGVIVDEKLNWSFHVSHVCKKLSKSISIIKKVKNILNSDTLKTLYNSLILPYINYCCQVWGNTSKYLIKKVVILQKRVVRIICKCNYKAHTAPLFKKCKLLKLKDIVDFRILVVMFKAKHKLLPKNIQDLFQINDNCYCTRQYGKFNHKYVRTSLKYKCVSVYGVKLWNGLNDELSSISSVFKFKVMLKKILLNMS